MSELTELKIGDRIKDNDPRGAGYRVLTIVELMPFRVRAESHHGHRTTILRSRIHSDGRARRSGFNLVRST